ncbi:Uncharacterised protein [[Clostridium] sordellii]|uniref:Uncharacterized protein n=1 Tax=Paraclostridium sordellii TaxID=1505 RepID=A0ABM9RTR1_PARSO|nr:hypothetical protein [Paeniclostridium sordellii]EPZ61175.1 hypothetical protein H477_0287 [[Clostridium] sordellii ATCC 9714] [Paeniclostridium sordellii ATCC 9714]TAN66891.1 hypothetical protein WS9_009330 [Paeniclostridium sordellii 8483]CEJ75483.1 hypothetical protein ATCC9714PCS11_00241 (plasmid) [[Clostridium] sordellii] [Paeniclostridium sordellii]CEK36608.1 hypothetical protein UMC2PCS14_00321 (plasmid) [[Clostridium] sordellii] [Paeniclostridium sordellii]CEN22441.1 Uncharacterised
MIKVYIDEVKGIFELEHNMCCREQLVNELTKILDIIIVDCEIKEKLEYKNKTLKEKEILTVNLRQLIINQILKMDCSCIEYLSNKEKHIKDIPCEYCKEINCSECIK